MRFFTAIVVAALASATCALNIPRFGVYRIDSVAAPISVRHCDYELFATPPSSNSPMATGDFQFNLIAALNGKDGAVSFQSVNFPDHYLAPITTEESGRLGIVTAPNSDDASFAAVAGLANSSALSFQSLSKQSALAGAYMALNGKLQGGCAGQYHAPASDVALVAKPDAASATFVLYTPPPPPPTLVAVNSDNVTHSVNPYFLGCHSDTGFVHQARGYYAQMIFGNSFEPSLPEGPAWVTIADGAQGTASPDPATPFHGNTSMKLTRSSAADGGVFGVANRGLGSEGLFIQAGKDYEGYLFVKSQKAVSLTVALRDFANGNVTLASATLKFAGGDWTRLDFQLNATQGTTCVDGSHDPRVNCGKMGPQPGHICVQCGGELLVGLNGAGSVNLDFVYLQPGTWGRVGDLPVLRSGVDMLQQMGVTLIRQGGSFTITDYYDWTKWIGPAYERPTMQAEWGDEVIAGWGPFEMVDMCAAAGITPAITVSADSGECCSPEKMADLVEFCYGGNDTTWGAKRHALGHPAPYAIKFFELGNEQYNHNYADQVAAMEKRAASLGMGNTLYYMNPNNGKWLSPEDAAKVEAVGIKDHAVMDEHVGATGAVENAAATFAANPTLTMGMVNAETNAGTHDMTRGVNEGVDLNDWFNCAAPWCSRIHFRTASFCTGRSGHYDNFDQSMAFFLPNMTWLQPPGYVHQMVSQTFQRNGLGIFLNDTTSTTASAQASDDGSTVVVRLTNGNAMPAAVEILVSPPAAFSATQQVLEIYSASGSAANTPSSPDGIKPHSSTISLAKSNNVYQLKPNSYTVVTFTRS